MTQGQKYLIWHRPAAEEGLHWLHRDGAVQLVEVRRNDEGSLEFRPLACPGAPFAPVVEAQGAWWRHAPLDSTRSRPLH